MLRVGVLNVDFNSIHSFSLARTHNRSISFIHSGFPFSCVAYAVINREENTVKRKNACRLTDEMKHIDERWQNVIASSLLLIRQVSQYDDDVREMKRSLVYCFDR